MKSDVVEANLFTKWLKSLTMQDIPDEIGVVNDKVGGFFAFLTS
jgi:hypothetical protein